MHPGKRTALAVLALTLIGDGRAVAHAQPSESSLQSAVREMRDTMQRAAPSNTTRTSTATSSARAVLRPQPRPEPGACAQQTRQACAK